MEGMIREDGRLEDPVVTQISPNPVTRLGPRISTIGVLDEDGPPPPGTGSVTRLVSGRPGGCPWFRRGHERVAMGLDLRSQSDRGKGFPGLGRK